MTASRSHTSVRRNHHHLRKICEIAARVAGEDRQARDLRMRPDEKVGQDARADAAGLPVFEVGLAGDDKAGFGVRSIVTSRSSTMWSSAVWLSIWTEISA